jgi:hypothetical protein
VGEARSGVVESGWLSVLRDNRRGGGGGGARNSHVLTVIYG